MKFLDECHFMDRELWSRKVVGPRNQRAHRIRPGRLEDSYSLTLMLDLSNNVMPYFFSLRHKSNTEWDFQTSVKSAIESGHLKGGDYLIVDNASVHCGSASWASTRDMLQTNNVKLLFLPKYSPELNPCELVFGYVKNYIRRNRGQALHKLMMEALISLPFDNIVNYYNRCTQIYFRYVRNNDHLSDVELNLLDIWIYNEYLQEVATEVDLEELCEIFEDESIEVEDFLGIGDKVFSDDMDVDIDIAAFDIAFESLENMQVESTGDVGEEERVENETVVDGGEGDGGESESDEVEDEEILESNRAVDSGEGVEFSMDLGVIDF